MAGEGHHERHEIGDVVEDVVADDDVDRGHPVGHVGPEALHLAVLDGPLPGEVGEGGQHRRALVDGGDGRRRRAQREAGGAGAGSDVEHRPALGKRFQGPADGRRRLAAVGQGPARRRGRGRTPVVGARARPKIVAR